MKEIAKKLTQYAYNNGLDHMQTIVDWLDFTIDMFSTDNHMNPNGWEYAVAEMAQENPTFADCVTMWSVRMTEEIEKLNLFDGVGRIYEEMFQSKGKASSLGQFFTPESICELMKRCVHDEDSKSCYDPACGSGRTLMAVRMEEIRRKTEYPSLYVGEDIDGVSARMCALNLMIYGCRGHVTCMDSLLRDGTWMRYVINEVRYPIPTPYLSIRRTKVKIMPSNEWIAENPDRYDAENNKILPPKNEQKKVAKTAPKKEKKQEVEQLELF